MRKLDTFSALPHVPSINNMRSFFGGTAVVILVMMVTLTWNSPAVCGQISGQAGQGNGASAAAPSPKVHGKKSFKNMTAIEVAQDPAAYGFKKGGTMALSPVKGSTMKPSYYQQWIKKASAGRVYILTIHYDMGGKIISAKWGGF